MNKVILMPMQPKWLAKILNGEKTIEIKKTMPKCELPIDVYLYCTKTNKKGWCMVGINGNETYYQKYDRNAVSSPDYNYSGNGKVVAKFTLKWCDKRSIAELTHSLSDFNTFLKRAGIDWYKNSKEFHDYVGEKDYIYAWHIDNLVIFDKPMELREFSTSPYSDWIEYRVHKAPKIWQYAWLSE